MFNQLPSYLLSLILNNDCLFCQKRRSHRPVQFALVLFALCSWFQGHNGSPKYGTGCSSWKVVLFVNSEAKFYKSLFCRQIPFIWLMHIYSPLKTMKKLFILSKKLFSFSRYSNFCIFILSSFSPYPSLV